MNIRDNNNAFSPKVVTFILCKYGLISESQKAEIIKRLPTFQKKLEKIHAIRHASTSSKGRIENPVTIVDVIASLQMERADDPSKILDEECIFQALAKAWKIPYRKIDPLKLDLNLVTTTIPHSFAMKHLVLPIDIKDGNLFIATPNPFGSG